MNPLRKLMDHWFPPGPAEAYRREARQRLKELSLPTSPDVVELGALKLFEHELQQMPREEVMVPRIRRFSAGLDDTGFYAARLASTMGLPGSLAPSVMAVLEDLQPARLWHSGGKMHVLGGVGSYGIANRLVEGESARLGAVTLTGVLRPDEVTHLEAAVRRLPDPDVLKAIHLRPVLGRTRSQRIMGLAQSDVAREVALENASVRDPGKAVYVLSHEVGHLVDVRLGGGTRYRSADPDTPFGKSQDRRDYISDYAKSEAREDFAETHALLVECWDRIQECPDLVHAAGAIGQKLAWILEHAYARPLPPPSPHLEKVTGFGWKTEGGTVIGAERDLAATALQVLRGTRPLTRKHSRLVSTLQGEQVSPERRPQSVAALTYQLDELGTLRMRYKRDGGEVLREQLFSLTRKVKGQLETGGFELREAVRAGLTRHDRAYWELRRLTPREA